MRKVRAYDAFVIVNPTAGSGLAGKRWTEVADALFRSLGSYRYAFTVRPGHARTMAGEALAAGYEMVVAVGGDGTASEVVSAFFDGARNRSPDAVFAVVPLGTGCDLGRTLVQGCNIHEYCAALGDRACRTIDVGHVRFVDQAGHEAQRVFVNVASFGCGGAVARSITAADKRLGARLGFNLAAAKALARYKNKTISVALDKRMAQRREVTNVAVCNAQYFGGGMWVSPQARVDDGELDITIWSGFGLKDFILKQRMLYDGSHLREERTQVARVKSLTANSEEHVFLEVDGEYVGQLPAAFRILPGALKMKVQG